MKIIYYIMAILSFCFALLNPYISYFAVVNITLSLIGIICFLALSHTYKKYHLLKKGESYSYDKIRKIRQTNHKLTLFLRIYSVLALVISSLYSIYIWLHFIGAVSGISQIIAIFNFFSGNNITSLSVLFLALSIVTNFVSMICLQFTLGKHYI